MSFNDSCPDLGSLRSAMGQDDYDFSVEAVRQLPLKHFEVAIHRLTNVAIPLHLELLNRHKSNISKFQRLSEWQKLDKELINASRTVQQLKADIESIDMIRNQIIECDQQAFDAKISETKQNTLSSLELFLDVHEEVTQPVIAKHANKSAEVAILNSDEILDSLDVSVQQELKRQFGSVDDISERKEIAVQTQIQNSKVPPTKVSSAWSDLKISVEELNKMIHGFASQVYGQKQHVNSIQDNIETAHENVKSGTVSLSKAAKLKMAVVPVAGAVIGGCFGGPVGLFLGAKVGMAAAVGASVVGYQTGKFIKRKQHSSTDVEMKKLSSSGSMTRSFSLPEVQPDSQLS